MKRDLSNPSFLLVRIPSMGPGSSFTHLDVALWGTKGDPNVNIWSFFFSPEKTVLISAAALVFKLGRPSLAQRPPGAIWLTGIWASPLTFWCSDYSEVRQAVGLGHCLPKCGGRGTWGGTRARQCVKLNHVMREHFLVSCISFLVDNEGRDSSGGAAAVAWKLQH